MTTPERVNIRKNPLLFRAGRIKLPAVSTAMPDEPDDNSTRILAAMARIAQVHRTIRTCVICATTISGLLLVCWTTVRLADIVPWWVFGLAVFILSAGPSSAAAIMVRIYRRHIKMTSARTQKLEEQVDPNRTSSNLLEDGRSSHGL